jgi:hypothetical protein
MPAAFLYIRTSMPVSLDGEKSRLREHLAAARLAINSRGSVPFRRPSARRVVELDQHQAVAADPVDAVDRAGHTNILKQAP